MHALSDGEYVGHLSNYDVVVDTESGVVAVQLHLRGQYDVPKPEGVAQCEQPIRAHPLRDIFGSHSSALVYDVFCAARQTLQSTQWWVALLRGHAVRSPCSSEAAVYYYLSRRAC